VWQAAFEKHRSEGFTVVGIALDTEGVAPAKRYYEKFGVTFPALVDPNYATGFEAVPKTFFVDEHGVVQELKNWEQRIRPKSRLRPVTDKIRNQWSRGRLDPAVLAALARHHAEHPQDLETAVELSSRYIDLKLKKEARQVLQRSIAKYSTHAIATGQDAGKSRLLGKAYFQFSRAAGNDKQKVQHATMAFYLNPSVGYGKQIARLIAPEKFDGRPQGDFDNEFREGTLRRLKREREAWLKSEP